MNLYLVRLLQENPVFSHLNNEVINKLFDFAVQQNYHSGEILTLAGDIWPFLFMVGDGSITVLKESSEGRGLSIAEFKPGDLFWGPAFFQEEALNPVTMKFDQDSLIFLWSRERILPILLENGALTWELSRLMVTRMLNASDLITGLAFQQVAGRLAHLLLKFPNDNQKGPMVRSLTLDDMASRIGSTREMVCRFLQGFANQGIIKITRTELEIIDRDQLEALSQKEKA